MSCSMASHSSSVAAAAGGAVDKAVMTGGTVALFEAWWQTANSELDEKASGALKRCHPPR
jgi:hypothetical protein